MAYQAFEFEIVGTEGEKSTTGIIAVAPDDSTGSFEDGICVINNLPEFFSYRGKSMTVTPLEKKLSKKRCKEFSRRTFQIHCGQYVPDIFMAHVVGEIGKITRVVEITILVQCNETKDEENILLNSIQYYFEWFQAHVIAYDALMMTGLMPEEPEEIKNLHLFNPDRSINIEFHGDDEHPWRITGRVFPDRSGTLILPDRKVIIISPWGDVSMFSLEDSSLFSHLRINKAMGGLELPAREKEQ